MTDRIASIFDKAIGYLLGVKESMIQGFIHSTRILKNFLRQRFQTARALVLSAQERVLAPIRAVANTFERVKRILEKVCAYYANPFNVILESQDKWEQIKAISELSIKVLATFYTIRGVFFSTRQISNNIRHGSNKYLNITIGYPS